MRFRVIEISGYSDVAWRLLHGYKPLKVGGIGYVTGIVCEYMQHKLYEVDIEGYGNCKLWDWQIEEI